MLLGKNVKMGDALHFAEIWQARNGFTNDLREILSYGELETLIFLNSKKKIGE